MKKAKKSFYSTRGVYEKSSLPTPVQNEVIEKASNVSSINLPKQAMKEQPLIDTEEYDVPVVIPKVPLDLNESEFEHTKSEKSETPKNNGGPSFSRRLSTLLDDRNTVQSKADEPDFSQITGESSFSEELSALLDDQCTAQTKTEEPDSFLTTGESSFSRKLASAMNDPLVALAKPTEQKLFQSIGGSSVDDKLSASLNDSNTAHKKPANPKSCQSIQDSSVDDDLSALEYQLAFLSGSGGKSGDGRSEFTIYQEELRTVPLFSGAVLDSSKSCTIQQYGLLAQHVMSAARSDPSSQAERRFSIPKGDSRIFLNVNTPWSTFICGSQGSGKSHTLSCILENCLIPSKLGQLPSPLTALVFHYDAFTSYGGNQPCEAAYLCSSGVPVNVLVSPTNYWRMKQVYENLPHLHSNSRKPKVIAMRFKDKQLDAPKMMSMMAVNDKEGPVPLYMEVYRSLTRLSCVDSYHCR